jgi:hypothetical protein
MKKLILIPFLHFICFCFAQDAKQIIGNPVKIGNLLVAEKDFPREMGSYEAFKVCKKLGNGWRLPSIDELKLIYKSALKKNVANFSMKCYYWSGTPYILKNPPPFISLDFSNGEEDWSDIYDPNNFPKTRAVKYVSK